MTFTIQVVGANELAASFTDAGRVLQKDAEAVVERAAFNIKSQMQRELAASPSFAGAEDAVSYDIEGTEAVIGPEVNSAGGLLAHIAALGSRQTPAWWDWTKADRLETPRLEKYLGDVAEKAL